MIVRWVLTVALLVMVWGEAGPWTSLTITLLAVANELQALIESR